MSTGWKINVQRKQYFGHMDAMEQLPLFDSSVRLAGVMPSVKAAMRQIAGDEKSEGRKRLAEKINKLAQEEQICLTGGNSKTLSLDTFNKWLSPSDTAHQPSILAILAFCKVTKNHAPLRVILQAIGCGLMTDEDRKYRDYGKATLEEKNARKRKRQLEERL